MRSYLPKTITCFLEGYSKRLFRDDLLAGVTVGVIALPLAMAFAIGAGVGPERGLFTAIVAGFCVALFGGSRVQVSGPTGAFVVVVYGIVQRHGYDGLVGAMLLASVLLVAMGLLRFGRFVRLIPPAVVTGFTAGIATVILVAQGKDLLGLEVAQPAAGCLERLAQYAQCIGSWNPYAVLVAGAALALIVGCRKWSKRVPGAILAIVAMSICVAWFQWPVETIEQRFGPLPTTVPWPVWPTLSLTQLWVLLPDAAVIALLAGLESLLSAVVADAMTGRQHRSNIELIAQGIGNFGAALCGGIPATGAIARTTANIQMQARTPVAGMIHAATLALLLLVCAPWAGQIPLAVLAAVLVVVAINMSEFERARETIRREPLVLITTYALTVAVDLTIAVAVGTILAWLSGYRPKEDAMYCSNRV